MALCSFAKKGMDLDTQDTPSCASASTVLDRMKASNYKKVAHFPPTGDHGSNAPKLKLFHAFCPQ